MIYFVVSDIHSDHTGLMRGLRLAGFQKKNKNHTLIVCGDIFDRFEKPVEVYKFLRSIPKKRRILIRGNHEDLFFKLLDKVTPDFYDYINGTVDTVERIAKYFYPEITCFDAWDELCKYVKKTEIYQWLKGPDWQNFAEIGDYIFVHSFIPTDCSALEGYDPNWRQASESAWGSARWGCPYTQYQDGFFNPEKEAGKILVVGHWNTSDFYRDLSGISSQPLGAIWYGRHLIGLDGGIYRWAEKLHHQQNVLIIDSENPTECSEAHLGKLTYQKEI